MKEYLRIVLLCMVVSVLFGVVHNQFSARISLEYFTIGHARIIHSTSPTLMGVAWGIRSTWWVGMSLGFLLALSGRFGPGKKRAAGSMVKPLSLLFLFCGLAAASMGVLGFELMTHHRIPFLRELETVIQSADRPGYMAALWMHTASYTAAAMGGAFLVVHVAFSRFRDSSSGTKG